MALGFRGRLVLGSTLQVVGFVGTAMLVLAFLIDRYADERAAETTTLARTSFAMQMLMERRSLRRETEKFASTPRLLATVATPGADERAVAEAIADMYAPIVAVLDPRGLVVAGSGCWPAGTDLAHLPGLRPPPSGAVEDHAWPHASGLAMVAIAPLQQDGELLGFLVRGEAVDSKLASRVQALAATDVLLLHDGVRLAERWSQAPRASVDYAPLERLRHHELPHDGLAVDLRIDGEPRRGLALRLHDDGGIVFLSQRTGDILALRAEARTWVLVLGLLLVGCGIAMASRTAARLSRPLLALCAASDRMGRGDLSARVDMATTDDEIGRLAHSFNSMADTLQALVADVRDKAGRAEAANRAKDGFLTSVSHELRTPLTGIQTTAELLQQFGEDASPAERHEFLTTILREAERLGRRITNTLQFANLAAGRAQWTVGRVDLQQACEQACRRLHSLQALKTVPFQIHCPDGAMLQGDREHITQAIYHLAHNAWTWSPADTEVDISVRAVQHGFVVDVADRGQGIPKGERERVFERFAQAGDVLVDKPAGVGIGLSIVAEVARMHGGAIDYSDRSGGGACFHLLLRTEDRPIDRLVGEPATAAAGS